MKREKTEHLSSFFHTPTEFAQSAFIQVPRAGHLKAAHDYRVDRRFCAGHDLILCLGGEGWLRCNGRDHRVRPLELAWLDGRFPHTHWADASEPWEVLWIRADGAALTRSAEILHVKHLPVFRVNSAMTQRFFNVLQHLAVTTLATDAVLNADLATILAALFEHRQVNDRETVDSPDDSPELRRLTERMSIYFYKKWAVPEMAKACHMTQANFYRQFHCMTGSSPIAWLRRQRVTHAKRRLAETKDPIKLIAEQVGYADPFYFSRDFRAACGMSPTEYREQESHLSSAAL